MPISKRIGTRPGRKAKRPARRGKTVADLMQRDVEVIRSDADVHELEKKLIKERIHGMPVVDADGTLVGVVSQSDLIAWHYFAGIDGVGFYNSADVLVPQDENSSLRLADIRNAEIAEVMSPVVYCICPDQPLALAAARMIARRIHRLIVVDETGRVAGIITATDLLGTFPGVDQALQEVQVEKALCDSPSAFSKPPAAGTPEA